MQDAKKEFIQDRERDIKVACQVIKVYLRKQGLRTYLGKLCLSQNALARMLGITTGYMSQISTGSRSVGPNLRRKMLRMFKKLKWDDLFIMKLERRSKNNA